MKCFLFFVFFCFWGIVVCGQQVERIVFYNVENLFDTKDEPFKQDDEYTPMGEKHWTDVRYMKKIRHLAEAVSIAGNGELPLVIGLAEVENQWVLKDFTSKTLLVEGNYDMVHQDSPDPRGIDVALLYRREKIRLLSAHFCEIRFPEDPAIRTRDVLYTKMLYQKDTLHFFVCHFPSMLGGEKRSEWKRATVAKFIRRKVDSLFLRNPNEKILIMGDLNGKANSWTQREVLKSKKIENTLRPGELYNTGYSYLKKQGIGTYRYKGNWQTIDHIIVSSGLLIRDEGCRVSSQMKICSAPFLLEEDKTYFGYKPRPTYRGPRYIGGVSDHLPISINLYSY